LHLFIGEILANMTQVSDVAPGPLVCTRTILGSKPEMKFDSLILSCEKTIIYVVYKHSVLLSNFS
jgi:hypothetical protein